MRLFQKFRAKTMLVSFFDWQGVIHKFVPEGQTINAVYYQGVMERLLNRIRRVRPGRCESGDWFLLHDNTPSHNATIFKQFLAKRKVTVLDHPPYSPDLAPTDYVLFPKVKSHLKGRLFDPILDIQKAVTSTTMITVIKKSGVQCVDSWTGTEREQRQHAEYFIYVGSVMTNDARCTLEIKFRIVMGKAAFNTNSLPAIRT
jgi:histone-lysine N-methyltransferase SETMAR